MRNLARRALSILVAFSALAAFTLPAWVAAQQPSTPVPASSAAATITVDFTDPQVSPSHWVLSFHQDGTGHFQSTMGNADMGTAGKASGDWQQNMQIPDVDRVVQLSPRFAASAFQTARQHAWFNQPCDGHMKVAFQGWKTFSYAGPDGQGSCKFNYSRDKDIQSMAESFVAVSETILEGQRLEMLLQHDPLGLEKEIESLTIAAQDGTAQQIGVIKGILQRLAQDDNVMEMVRKRARLLLARADS